MQNIVKMVDIVLVYTLVKNADTTLHRVKKIDICVVYNLIRKVGIGPDFH